MFSFDSLNPEQILECKKLKFNFIKLHLKKYSSICDSNWGCKKCQRGCRKKRSGEATVLISISGGK
jgi:hypothetical protein